MPSNSPRPNDASYQPAPALAGQALPLSHRRLHTLQAMEHSITLSAKFLEQAKDEFQNTLPLSGDASRSQIHLAKRLVNEALELLHGIESLVGVNPTQIARTSSSVIRIVEDIKQIHRVSRRLMRAPDERHYPQALPALERRCERMSQELTRFANQEIKTAQREIAHASAMPSSALIA